MAFAASAACGSGRIAGTPGDSGVGPGEAGADVGSVSHDGGSLGDGSASGCGCPSGSSCTTAGGNPGVCCNDACADTMNDPLNCGSCGFEVLYGQTCKAGAPFYESCATAPPDYNLVAPCALANGGAGACCGGKCVADFNSDPNNCGSCAAVCPPGSTCTNGGCTSPSGSCDGPCPPGTVTGNLCACYLEGSSCSATTNELPCMLPGDQNFPSGLCCDASCINFDADPKNCGACGHACGAGQLCNEGACTGGVACSTQTQNQACVLAQGRAGLCCGGACVDTTSDPSNCDGCGLSCGVGTCTDSQCMLQNVMASCENPGQPGYFACPPGTTCYLGYSCVASTCASAGASACTGNAGGPNGQSPGACCAAGDGGCPNFGDDPNNCGGCGVGCPSGVCSSGRCWPPPSCSDCSGAGGCPTGTECVSGHCVESNSACLGGGGSYGQLCAALGGVLGLCCGGEEAPTSCADILRDPNNCGGCLNICPSGSCVNGACK